MNLAFHGIKHENTAAEKHKQYLLNPGFIWNTQEPFKYYVLFSFIGRTSYEHNSYIIFNMGFKK